MNEVNNLVDTMEVWGLLVVLAVVAVTVPTVSGKSATFPEIARERSSRIVSGWEATEGQFPYQLSMRMVSATGGVNSCGASIIHEQWGLTAAHCTAGRVNFVLRGGVVNLTRPYYIFETSDFYNHPLYNNNIPSVVQLHDIGLLAFGRTLVFNELVQPIRLQRHDSRNFNYDGVRMVASGWGRTWTNSAAPENLNWVYLRGNTNDLCREQFGAIVGDSTICASGYNDTTQSTCQGDSGGPLTIIDDDGELSHVGVTSFVSRFGCHADYPAGFIRPGHYHEWFTNITGIDFNWEYSLPTTTGVPEEATSVAPEETTTVAPKETTTIAPQGTTTIAPEETTTI